VSIVERLRQSATLVPVVPGHFLYPRDPDDEHVINLAVESGARYLVTRDKDLLDLMDENRPEGRDFRQRFPNLTTLDPVAFLQELAIRRDSEPERQQPEESAPLPQRGQEPGMEP
jgi:predicted nucleic acid-binding protein